MKAAASQPITCPKCQSTQITSHGKRYALYPAGCLTLFALPLAWLHRESTPYDFECRDCVHSFSKRTLSAKVAYAGLWLAVGVIIAWFIAMILYQQ